MLRLTLYYNINNDEMSVIFSDCGIEKVKKNTSRIINYLKSQDGEILFNHKLSRHICNKITLSKYVIFKTIPEWNNLSGNILAACSSTSLPRQVRI